jgi:RecA/RadA recombinase
MPRPKKIVDVAVAEPPKKRGRKKKSDALVGEAVVADSPLHYDSDRNHVIASRAPDLGFDILDPKNDIMTNAAKVLSSVVARRKNQSIGMAPASEIRQNVLWVPEFELQHTMGFVGIPHGSMTELIAPEGVGKTSLVFTIAGWAMNVGAPVVYVECEGKQMPPSRIVRMLSSDPKKALLMLDRLRVESISSLEHLNKFIIDYVDAMRGRKPLKEYPVHVPNHIPLVIIVDPWSRLMNQDEAAMFYDYGDNLDAKKNKYKETNTGTKLGHAQFASAWCRRLAYMAAKDNLILILTQHQTEDLKSAMAMSYGPKIVLPESITGLSNKTHIGGRALHQWATQQWVMTKRSNAKFADKTASGKNVNMAVVKNSIGAEAKKMYFEIRAEHREDVPGVYLEPGLHFEDSFARWFTTNKYLGSKMDTSGDTFTCEDMGLRAVDAAEFHRVFHQSDELRTQVGSMLRIEGYLDTVEKIRAELISQSAATSQEVNVIPPEPPATYEEYVEEFAGSDAEDIVEVYE